MKLVELIPDPDALLVLEPDELGLRMLPVLSAWHRNVVHNDADEAAEIIMLANHLLRIVDARGATRGQQP